MRFWQTASKSWHELGHRKVVFGVLWSAVLPGAVFVVEAVIGALGGSLIVPQLAYLVLYVFSVLFVIVYFLLKRLQEFESLAEVSLSLSDPVVTMKPGDRGKSLKRYSLKVTNDSDREIRNVQLKMARFTNRYGKETNDPGARFPVAATSQGSTEIAAHDSELFHIALADEYEKMDGAQMLYVGEDAARFIPSKFFPHQLVVKLTADGLVRPVERTFVIRLEENRKLFVEPSN
jgi:hypothetical protein